MICQECNLNEATVTLNTNINGVKSTRHLCPSCAAKYGIGQASGIGEMFSGLFGNVLGMFSEAPQELSCKGCGYTLSQYNRTGLLGCEQCYDSFRQQLLPFIKRVHGNVVNKPDEIKPDSKQEQQDEISKLKKELQEAIQAEEYEKAAQLRDRIKLMEKEEEA
ncbi:MAG: UvrB/UvrC motif-containing protein [Clostridiales bacterium]|nr:UvrB/UvrC motif-containing protein [Clostridiales bacterium]